MPLRAASMQLRRSLCATLLVALVLAQTLGLVHRIVHAPLGGHPAFAAGAAATLPAGNIDWLKALFSGHASEQGCDLYDQFGHADGVPSVTPMAVPLPSGDRAVASHAASWVAAPPAGCLARGPPQTS